MKKKALVIIIMSIGLIGCSNEVTQKKEDASDKINIEQVQPQVSEESKNEISVNEAKEIALKHANLTSDKVTFIKAELDVDDGVRKYDIEFSYNKKEYDYEINSNTGNIISYDID